MALGCNDGCAPSLRPRGPSSRDAARTPFAAFVAEASQRFGIPAAWIRAVMRAESFGDVRAISPKGAMGLMQIMPETWATLRQRYRLGADPYDAHDNIIAGAAYLRELHDRYGIPGFLAAYNAGPARWEDHLATGRPLPAETRAYLSRLAPIVGGSATDDTVIARRRWSDRGPRRRCFRNTSVEPPTTRRPLHRRRSRSAVDGHHPAQDWTGTCPAVRWALRRPVVDGSGRNECDR